MVKWMSDMSMPSISELLSFTVENQHSTSYKAESGVIGENISRERQSIWHHDGSKRAKKDLQKRIQVGEGDQTAQASGQGSARAWGGN